MCLCDGSASPSLSLPSLSSSSLIEEDAECLTQLLCTHLHRLLDLFSSESIVRDFFHRLSRQPTSARLLLRVIHNRFVPSVAYVVLVVVVVVFFSLFE